MGLCQILFYILNLSFKRFLSAAAEGIALHNAGLKGNRLVKIGVKIRVILLVFLDRKLVEDGSEVDAMRNELTDDLIS